MRAASGWAKALSAPCPPFSFFANSDGGLAVGTRIRANRRLSPPYARSKSAQRRQFARQVFAGLPVIGRGKRGIGKDHRPGRELAEHFGATSAIVTIRHMRIFLPDRRGIGVVSRGRRTEYAKIDRDQDGAEAVFGCNVVGFCQADQSADFPSEIGTDVRFGEPGAEFLIVGFGRATRSLRSGFRARWPKDCPRPRAHRDSPRCALGCDSGGPAPRKRHATHRGSSRWVIGPKR
jgi:hypothetical protein